MRAIRKAVNFLMFWTIVSIAVLSAIGRTYESSYREYLWLIPAIILAFLTFKILKFALFRSTRYLNKQGYVVLRKTNELEHRAIAVEIMERDLYVNEVVHHINGRRDDNRVSNLCLMDREKHELFHSWLRWKKEKSGYYPRFKDQKRILQDEYGGTLLAEKNYAHSSWIAEPISSIEPSPKRTSNSMPPTTPPAQFEQPTILNEDQKRLLFINLRDERKRISEILKIPPYKVFVDKTLLQMAKEAPISRHEMLEIEGVTDEKYEAYGPYFVEVVRTFRKSINNGKDTA